MYFKSNKKIEFEIFYCGKTLTSFSKKITVFKRDPVEKSGKIKKVKLWTTWNDILSSILTNCVPGMKKIVMAPTTVN